MADLDDFFAKKDRKKSKSKKFLTNEELAKKLEDTTRKTETKPRKERPIDSDEPDTEDVVSILLVKFAFCTHFIEVFI